MLPLLLTLACTSPSESPATAALVLTDDNTYAVDVDLDFPERSVASRTDLQITWEDLATDVWGEPLGERQVGRVLLVGLTRSTAEMTEAFQTWTTQGTDVTVYVDLDLEPDTTSVQLSDLSFLGAAWYPEEEFHDDGWAESWFLLLEDAHDTASDALLPLAWMALQPDDSTAAVPVDFAAASGTLDLTVDLQPAGPLIVSPDATSWTVDCAGITEPSAGTLDTSAELFVAHSVLSVDEAQADPHGVELDQLYLPLVEGQSCLDGPVDLGGLVEQDSGEAFAGFDAGGTWFVGVRSPYPFVEEGLPVVGAVVALAD